GAGAGGAPSGVGGSGAGGAPSGRGGNGAGGVLPDAGGSDATSVDPAACGVVLGINSTLVNFDCVQTLALFDFFTPEPYRLGPPSWHWVGGTDSYLLQTANVIAQPFLDASAVSYGTFALFRPFEVEDALVS